MVPGLAWERRTTSLRHAVRFAEPFEVGEAFDSAFRVEPALVSGVDHVEELDRLDCGSRGSDHSNDERGGFHFYYCLRI